MDIFSLFTSEYMDFPYVSKFEVLPFHPPLVSFFLFLLLISFSLNHSLHLPPPLPQKYSSRMMRNYSSNKRKKWGLKPVPLVWMLLEVTCLRVGSASFEAQKRKKRAKVHSSSLYKCVVSSLHFAKYNFPFFKLKKKKTEKTFKSQRHP